MIGLREAATRIERAMDDYAEALFQATRLRLRALQRDFFPKSVVTFRELGWREMMVEIQIDGENARDIWCYEFHETESPPGIQEAVELEDWHEDQANEWNIRIKDIRLEARR